MTEERALKHSGPKKPDAMHRWGWPAALILMGLGLLLFPIHLRVPLLTGATSGYISINWCMVLALLLLLLADRKEYSRTDIVFILLWLLLWVPVIVTKWGVSVRGQLRVILNLLVTVFLLVQRMAPGYRKKWLGRALLVFDIFIIALLVMGICEKRTDGAILKAVVDWFASRGLETQEFKRYLAMNSTESYRFHFLWGHALTNGFLFNAFFVLNDIYYRNAKKRYPKLLFFGIALGGVLLCAGKTAIVVLCVYLVISNWQQKLWLLAYGAGAGVMFAAGFFRKIIERFTHGSLTSGRVDALKAYFTQDRYPLRFLTGYGTSTVYKKPLVSMKAAFEFPVLMFAIDYGILFSVVFMGSIFVYYTICCFRRRQLADWLGISLIFAQMNTYNGWSLINQDVAWMMGVFFMLALNSVCMSGDPDVPERLPEITGSPVRRVLLHILWGS